MSSIFSYILIILNFLFYQLEPTKTTVEDIVTRPNYYKGKYVEVNGLVILYSQGPGGTNYYFLRGDYGGLIRVNTLETSPVINKKYIIRGIIYLEREYFPRWKTTVFLSEKSRSPIEFTAPNITLEPEEITPGQVATLTWNAPEASKVLLNNEEVNVSGKREIFSKETKEFHLVAIYPDGSSKESRIILKVRQGYLESLVKNYFVLILIFVLVVSLSFLIVYLLKRKSTVPSIQTPPLESKPVKLEKENLYNKPAYTTSDEFKTIKISAPPKTLKFIPGKFVIISGEDKGKELRIAGYPTKAGFIVSVGRKEVLGEKAFAHIQLKEKTVSREQAEFIYDDNKLFVRNLSETNYTQLNGVDLKPGEISEVFPKSIIKFGEVEFQYLV